jgi:hypothetical protein
MAESSSRQRCHATGTSVVVLFAACLAVSLGAALGGHHSFAAYYFEDQTVEIEGTLVEFQYRSPHAWVHVAVAGDSGGPRVYAAEWANPTRLERDGITKTTLRADDPVRIWGSPGRDPSERKIHLKRILRTSDGWEWRQRRPR